MLDILLHVIPKVYERLRNRLNGNSSIKSEAFFFADICVETE